MSELVKHTRTKVYISRSPPPFEFKRIRTMEDEPPTEQEVFYELGTITMGLRDEFVEALVTRGVDTCDMLLAQHGLGGESPADAAVVALLGRLKAVERSIDVRIDGADATAIRGLQLKSRRISAGGGIGLMAPRVAAGLTAAAEEDEIADTKAASGMYLKLAKCQNVAVPQEDEMDHSSMRRMRSCLEKTGTINMPFGLANLTRQTDKRKVNRQIKGSGLWEMDVDSTAEEGKKPMLSKVVLALLVFADGLAAVLNLACKDITKGSALLVKSGAAGAAGGAAMVVHATHHNVLVWVRVVIKAIGLYPLRYADGIFRRAFAKQMELKNLYGFTSATTKLVGENSKYLEPDQEELREFEASQKAREDKDRQARNRKAGDKHPRDVATPGTAKKPEDGQKPPCHGQVYHGKCNKDGCGYDHNTGRCAAFKAAHPDKPPARV